jgi:UPF0755 protein
MKLETDPTVQYAIGYVEDQNSWWKNPLTLNDLKVDSPYNTYRNVGLPPGPICSADISAFNALAEYPESNYFYFRSRCDGSGYHDFSRTFDEHLSNACVP